jgi:REP element-mobilizing transposase RayT
MKRRRLPHIYPEGGWLFVTWHLHGSLPQALYPPPGKPSAGKAFVWMDRYLDTTRQGPMYLRQPEVAALIVEALQRGLAMKLYDLRAFVIMGNHVHVLFRPEQQASRALQWLKGTTARAANQFLSRTGKPFWQRESYDHWVRDERELERIAAYIENNPVQAALAAEASQYKWSSAWKDDGPPVN